MGGWAHQLQADLKTQLGSLLKRERVERANKRVSQLDSVWDAVVAVVAIKILKYRIIYDSIIL